MRTVNQGNGAQGVAGGIISGAFILANGTADEEELWTC